MRILWFTNTPSNYHVKICGGYGGGGWISSLESEMRKLDNVELAVSFFMPGQPFKENDGRVTYYPIDINDGRSKCHRAMSKIVDYFYPHSDQYNWRRYEEYYLKVVDDFKPDIIQVFGSEESFALIASRTNIPLVLHIQGILTPYLTAFLPPFVSWRNFIWNSINPLSIIKNWHTKRSWTQNVIREQEMVRRVKYFFGRTDWDQRVTKVINPNALYFFSSEVLRPSFYEPSNRVLPEKFTIVTTISQPLYKGFDLVLNTAYWMRKYLNMEFDWKVYGNIDPRVVEKSLGLSHDNLGVKIMGVASQDELCEAMRNASVYVHSSYIDNSPNSLCEAQMLGLPVVTTNVGGIPSLVEDGVTGYLVPANDPYQMAYHLWQLSMNAQHNVALGEKAKEVAFKRHDRHAIVVKMMSDYEQIIRDNK